MIDSPQEVVGVNFRYLRIPCKYDDNKYYERWRCLNVPKQWDGDLRARDISAMENVSINENCVRRRLVEGRLSVFGGTQQTVNKPHEPSLSNWRLAKKFLSLPAPSTRPTPSFGVW